MMNGALTIGTRDGATIEMAEQAGDNNFSSFGLTAKQVEDSAGWYNPQWHYDHEPETREALDLIFSIISAVTNGCSSRTVARYASDPTLRLHASGRRYLKFVSRGGCAAA